MRTEVHWDEALRTFQKALLNGAARQSATWCHWHIEGDCSSPWYRVIWGRPSAPGNTKYYVWTPGQRGQLTIEIWSRCNKCSECLWSRARMWSHRIKYETENAPRTWFGTLTLNPLWHLRCEVMARKEGKKPLAISGYEVTRYLKRLRHHATAKLRYVCVTEEHKSGKPHYHLLIHEQTRGALTHRVLAEHWTWGFERWRVVDPQSQPAWYLCKYLTKSNYDRIRASILYGGRQKET